MKTECETRQRLLDTAMALIWEQSYGAVSVDDICERAGAKKGSFYHFFPSKSDLAVAAIDDHWQKLRPDLDRIFSPQTPPLERLAGYCDLVYEQQKRENAEIWQGLRLCVHFPGLGVEHAGRKDPAEIAADSGLALQVSRGGNPGRRPGRAGSRNRTVRTRRVICMACVMGVLLQAKIENNLEIHPPFETDDLSIDWRAAKSSLRRQPSLSRVILTDRSTNHRALEPLFRCRLRRTPCGLSA